MKIDEGQELCAVLIDIQGSFCMRKFNEKVRNIYDKYNLWKTLGKNPSERQVTNDKHNFIKTVLSNFHVFTCMDAIEFNLAVRSLATFFRKNKNVGLLVIDGLHFIESNDFMSNFEKRQAKHSDATKKMNTSMEEMAKLTVPTGDDFFDSEPKQQIRQSA
jgi:hypothetical protein